MQLARAAIRMALFPHHLREWWQEEALRRAKYGISEAQERELIALCKTRIAEIEEEAEPYAVI